MPSKYALSISVTEHLSAFIRSEVATGRYSSASEVVRAGLRLLEEQASNYASSGSKKTARSKRAAPAQGKARAALEKA
ncbi:MULTISPECIES: type II toxin-antitoxin system ParD family antitoxin [Caballeronia]|uniref:type II toxin-antitoxin system ParD family antitoxin n=1 Tax=Caballeronia TaxID=1827195 RepID=UPI001FD0C5FA|nr:type II toxin-antitoxin system ParD family antitoxin [Caballeronia grimmiae]